MRDDYQDVGEFAERWIERPQSERLYHIAYRMDLVRFWEIQEGAKILEIGCGQGGTTFALALAVGESGHIVAVDSAPAEYGTPPLGEAQANIGSSSVGNRITFQLNCDVLDPAVQFGNQSFDAVVFSHSSWYLNQPSDLYAILRKTRPWARRLCFAESDIIPHYTTQIPHMLAVLLQVQMRALNEQLNLTSLNVRSLITRDRAHEMATQAGWNIQREKQFDASMPFLEGRWESEITQDVVNGMLHTPPSGLLPYAKDLLDIEVNLLKTLVEASGTTSLSSFAFWAE